MIGTARTKAFGFCRALDAPRLTSSPSPSSILAYLAGPGDRPFRRPDRMVLLAGWVFLQGTSPAAHAFITGSMMRQASSASSPRMNSIGLLWSMSGIRWAQAVNRGGAGRAPELADPGGAPGGVEGGGQPHAGLGRAHCQDVRFDAGPLAGQVPGRGRKWMVISAGSAARALPEHRVSGTPCHRGLFT
jgi:hypothetical protein